MTILLILSQLKALVKITGHNTQIEMIRETYLMEIPTLHLGQIKIEMVLVQHAIIRTLTTMGNKLTLCKQIQLKQQYQSEILRTKELRQRLLLQSLENWIDLK